MAFHYGKAPATADARDLKFSTYRTTTPLRAPPDDWGFDNVVPQGTWGMLGNDSVGDCVFAGFAHEVILTSTVAGHPSAFTDDGVLSDYSAVTGYVPGDHGTDKGTNVRDGLSYRRSTGIVDATGQRHKIGAYLALDLTKIAAGDFSEIAESVYLLGAVGLGIQVPQSAETEFSAHEMWSYVAGSPNAGGHYVPVIAHRRHVECVTWGRMQTMGARFLERYVDEAWAIVSPDFLNAAGQSPEGFNLAQLTADLAQI